LNENGNVAVAHLAKVLRLDVSKELDIIISDKRLTPILFEANDGTQYFPYEPVYAIGEVKSSFDPSKSQFLEFIQRIEQCKNLYREKVSPNYIGNGQSLGPPIVSNCKVSYRNPLFSFMIFASSEKFELRYIEEFYNNSYPNYLLPNIVVLLERGVIVNTQIDRSSAILKLGSANTHPEFNEERGFLSCAWSFLPFKHPGAELAFFTTFLNQHFQDSQLMPPDLTRYLDQLFAIEQSFVLKNW
jgi:hypothetical protein